MSNILKAFKKASTPALLGFSVLASTVPQASANELLTNFTDYVTKHGSVSLDADGVDVGVYKPTDNISIRVQQGFDPALPGVSVGHYKKTSVGDLNTSIGVNQHASVGGFHEPDIQINNFAEFVDEAVKGTENDANNLQARFSNVFDAQSHHYNGLTIKLDNEIYGAKIAAGLTNDGETFLFGRGIVTKNIDVDTSLAAGASIAHVGDSTDIDGIASIRHRVLGIPVGDETIATVTGQVSHNMQSGNTDYGFEG